MVFVGYAEESPWQYVETVKNEDIYINPISIKSYSQGPYDYVKCKVKIDNNNGTYNLYLMLINKDTKDWELPLMELYNNSNKLLHRMNAEGSWNRYEDGIFQNTIDAILELEQKGSK